MFFVRVKRFAESSVVDEDLKITMRSACVLGKGDLPVEMLQGFHERLEAKIEAAARSKIR
jgi:hypothetical protein